jgi:hypothetical protein
LDLVSGVNAATQAEQEAGTSTTVYVSPGRQHFHESAAKGWCTWGADAVIDESYNVASITDNGTGDHTINWDTDFSTTTYSCHTSQYHGDNNINRISQPVLPAVGSMQVASYYVSDTTGGGTKSEANMGTVYIVAYGDHA